MIEKISYGPFAGLYTALGADAPSPYASDMLNVRVTDGHLHPRFGYRNLSATPDLFQGAFGLGYLSGYDGSYTFHEEWASVEGRAGDVHPYSVSALTGARSEIRNGSQSVSLAASPWKIVQYGDSSYWINPLSPASVYKHDIGDLTSFSGLSALPLAIPSTLASVTETTPSGSGYVEVPIDTAVDTLSGSAGGSLSFGSVGFTGSGRPRIHVGGSKGYCEIVITFAAGKDLSDADALVFEIENHDGAGDFQDGFTSKQSDNYVVLTNSVPTSSANLPVVVRGIIDSYSGSYFGWVDLTGVASAIRSDTAKITIRFGGMTAGGTAEYAVTHLESGGVRYRDASGSFATDTTSEDPQLYAYNYTEGANVSEALSPATLTVLATTFLGEQFGGSSVGTLPLPYAGSLLSLSLPTTATSPYTSAAHINLYRKVGSDWIRIGQSADNSEPFVFTDNLRDSQLVADPVTYPVTSLTFQQDTFVQTGVVSAFPFKGWMVWCYPGATANVRHSRVGDAEKLHSALDGQDDDARGADFTLADDLGDAPIGGVQAGDMMLILGSKGCYDQSGESPSTMTPCRKIPGSMGCAGRFAFTRFRSDDGIAGIAWLDVSGENIWFAGAHLAYAVDTQARPVELSRPIRGYVRDFLLAGQLDTLPNLALSDAVMDVDEATGSLWVVLGARALVLRPPSLVDDQRFWEAYEYSVQTSSESSVDIAMIYDTSRAANFFLETSGTWDALSGELTSRFASYRSAVLRDASWDPSPVTYDRVFVDHALEPSGSLFPHVGPGETGDDVGGFPSASDECLNTVVNALPARTGKQLGGDFTPPMSGRKIVVMMCQSGPGAFAQGASFDGSDSARAHSYALQAFYSGIQILSVFLSHEDTDTQESDVRAVMEDYASVTGGAFIEISDTYTIAATVGTALGALLDKAAPAASARFLAFAPNRRLRWIRSSGEVDEIEWNSDEQKYIEGRQRDGGLPMPMGHWKTGAIRPGHSRLGYVGIEREDYRDTPGITAFSDRITQGVKGRFQRGRHFTRLPAGQTGFMHQLCIDVSEKHSGVLSLTAEFVKLSEGRSQ